MVQIVAGAFFPLGPMMIGAGGGIRTHEGLRHGIAHPRFCQGINRIDALAVLGLECSARVLGATRPFGQIFDLTLVPPLQTMASVAVLKYVLRRRLQFCESSPSAIHLSHVPS